MSDVQAEAERLSFGDIKLQTILPLPSGIFAEYLPHHADPIRRAVSRGALNTSLDLLMEAENLKIPLGKREKWEAGVESKLSRIEQVKACVKNGLPADITHAEVLFLLGSTYIDLQNLVKTVGIANKWEDEEIRQSADIMAAELTSGDKAKAWVWWIDLLGQYEQRKLTSD